MAQNASEARLMFALGLANDWLKYAEVKNGALLTINGALIVGMHQMLDWHEMPPVLIEAYVWIATAFLAASMLVGLASFYARTKTFGFDIENVTGNGASNALYYGHLADMKRTDVLSRLVDGYDPTIPNRYLEDAAEQIIINSKITRRKFALFNFALMLTIAAGVTPVGALLYYWSFCDDRL
ncbi:MAG: hypothetical protein K0U74_10165 [Alphaproteobacteria bacterium]|nr:hypothetical protein [Alphaproteobacteria bacterium]